MRRTRIRRRRRSQRSPAQPLFFAALLVGICLGLILAWAVDPTSAPGPAGALRGVEPEQVAALVALAWSVDEDHERAAERLNELKPAGVAAAQYMADMACRLASTDFVTSPGGRAALRSMMNFYQRDGRSGCADTLLPAIEEDSQELTVAGTSQVPVATLVPPPSKTPAPAPLPVLSLTATVGPTVTAAPLRLFVLAGLGSFCDAERPGLLEVFVQERDGRGIPAMELRVHWDNGEDRFFSGLKPERGLAYADFAMQEGQLYRIDMPGRAESSQEFATDDCVDEGVATLRSWRALFQPDN